jgi:hypothetical protein
MDDKIIAIFCLCDDLLKAMHHQKDRQCQMNDAEIMTGVGKEVCNFPDGADNWLISGVLRHTPCSAPQPYSRWSLIPCVRKVHLLHCCFEAPKSLGIP